MSKRKVSGIPGFMEPSASASSSMIAKLIQPIPKKTRMQSYAESLVSNSSTVLSGGGGGGNEENAAIAKKKRNAEPVVRLLAVSKHEMRLLENPDPEESYDPQLFGRIFLENCAQMIKTIPDYPKKLMAFLQPVLLAMRLPSMSVDQYDWFRSSINGLVRMHVPESLKSGTSVHELVSMVGAKDLALSAIKPNDQQWIRSRNIVYATTGVWSLGEVKREKSTFTTYDYHTQPLDLPQIYRRTCKTGSKDIYANTSPNFLAKIVSPETAETNFACFLLGNVYISHEEAYTVMKHYFRFALTIPLKYMELSSDKYYAHLCEVLDGPVFPRDIFDRIERYGGVGQSEIDHDQLENAQLLFASLITPHLAIEGPPTQVSIEAEDDTGVKDEEEEEENLRSVSENEAE